MNTLLKLSAAGALVVAASQASALTISTSASFSQFGDDYSYLFEISDTMDPTTYTAKLTNTSTSWISANGPQIDALYFNTDPDFTCCGVGDELYIANITPDWSFSLTGGAVLFDYVGEADNAAMNANRLGPGEMLTFDMIFSSAQSLDVFANSESDRGIGIGAGDESGQVCASFQGLGSGGQDSDQLCSNWESVPEASSLALLGLGLLGIGVAARRKVS